MLDLTDSIVPKSDQMNADDLMSGPRTFTIAEVRKASSAEQPVDVVLAEFPTGRPFKPSKSMRRVMVMAWGADAAQYVGHRLTLFRDPTVRFGAEAVGGIRISHMSHISNRMTVALTVTRGRRAPYVVEPLPDSTPASAPVAEDTVARLAELRAEWKTADPRRRKVIEVEVKRLSDAYEQGAGSKEDGSADTAATAVSARPDPSNETGEVSGPAPADGPEPGVEPQGHDSEPDGDPSAGTPAPAEGKPATRHQLVEIHGGLADFELDQDGNDERRLWVLSTIVGRRVERPEDLTEPEAKVVVDTFEAADRSAARLKEIVEALEADRS